VGTQRVTGYVTIYGNHGGDPRFVLVSDYAAAVLSISEAVLAKRRGVSYQLPGAMTERERELAHEAWLRREPAA
jgi:hypothetical protein